MSFAVLSGALQAASADLAVSAQLVLVVAGDAGRVHHVQHASTPEAGGWETVFTYLASEAPKRVVLPPPQAPARYWRVWAE